MKTGMFLLLAAIMMLLGTGSAASAKSGPAEHSCWSSYGDIWGENRSAMAAREIDGSQIESPAIFAQLTDLRLQDVTIIRGGDFSGWDFSATRLSGICFDGSDLTGASFAHASAPGAGFINADLTGANMTGAYMTGVMFRDAGLQHVTAAGADFSHGHFDGGWFEGSVEGWNIAGANLSGFTFECGITLADGCPVYQGGARMRAEATDFTGATLHSFGLHDADLTGAILDQTIIGPRQLPYLAEAEFRGAVILRGGSSDASLAPDEARKLLAAHAVQKRVVARPSFDCGKAASRVEMEICGEYASGLRAADREIATLYQRAKGMDSGVTASQRAWLKQRNRCAAAEYPVDCIRESYADRKGALLGLLGEQDWLAPGESALFIDDMLPLPAVAIRSELFARIAPVLVGASMTEILIERAQDGLYAIKGSAVGANAHLCSLSASHLYLDRESGWYISVSEGPAIPIFRIFDDRLEIFANGRPDHEKYPEAADYMSCGMRASFGETIRAQVSDALIEAYRKSLNEAM